jgi:DNA-binding LytR/AlgR family response regulator
MRTLIIDDNEIARLTLRELARQLKGLVIIGEFASAMEAYQFMQENEVDLLLLDIEMPGMSGIELTQHLGEKAPIIVFTSSKSDYAAEAFELSVADYIVKPVTPARFLQSIERARELLESRQQRYQVSPDEFIFIRDSNVIRKINLDDILFAEAMGDYVKIHTPQRFYAIHATLKAVEERLPANRFIRVHRSYIVSVEKIDSIEDGSLIMKDKHVPVADAYRSSLNKRMNIL